MALKANIRGGAAPQLTVADLDPGQLFTVASKLSDRLWVRCGDGLSTAYRKAGHARRSGGQKVIGREVPPSLAVIVPTEGCMDNRFDRRAYCPNSNKITGDTPVAATHGFLVVNAG